MSYASNSPLPTYERHDSFDGEIEATRAGAEMLRVDPTLGKSTPQEFSLIFEHPDSNPPDWPHLRVRIDADQLRALVESVSPYLAPSNQAYHLILEALARIECLLKKPD